jgi:hypothetical protein
MRSLGLAALSLLVLPLATAPAAASTFCGCNGEVALSFTPAPELTAVLEQAPDAQGLTRVEVHAVLVDVAELEGPRGVFQDLGGYELELRITGAEPLSVSKQHLIPYRDFGARPTQCLVGTTPGEPVVGQPLALVKWQLVFQGEVEDVRFDLDPAGIISCERTPGCEGSGASAMYVGTVDARQEGYIFAAGARPAVLNPTGEPELEPQPCTRGFAEVGVYQER